MEEQYKRTVAFVQETLADAEGGHDWQHIQRVLNNAKSIATTEPHCDETVVILAALLHDIADSKFHDGDETIGPRKADAFMKSEGIAEATRAHVVKIIENISFKGGNRIQTFDSLELRIVQDADRLDAIGAIGIARAFHYGGFKNRPLYDPNVAPRLHMTAAEYKANSGPTINHFYEKLLLLKDRMNTVAAQKMANQRHLYMLGFLKQFEAECQGN